MGEREWFIRKIKSKTVDDASIQRRQKIKEIKDIF